MPKPAAGRYSGRLRIDYRGLREQLGLRTGMPLTPLMPEDIDEARALVQLRDPFDRLIAGTAVRLALPLLTNDSRITASGRLRTYW
jgi:PIN domain nuclease of toxin-antitoxin system